MGKRLNKKQESASRAVAQEALPAAAHAADNPCVLLSARDAAQVLHDIQNPPPPNAAAVRAARRFRRRDG